MDPTMNCRQALAALRAEQGGRLSDRARWQTVILLSTYAQQELCSRDFSRALSLLIERAERSGRLHVATAAREVLHGWQSQAVTP